MSWKNKYRDIAKEASDISKEKVEFVGLEDDDQISFQVSFNRSYKTIHLDGTVTESKPCSGIGPLTEWYEINLKDDRLLENLVCVARLCRRSWERKHFKK